MVDPETPESPLLQPDEKGMEDFLVPGLLGLAGAALLYKTFSSKGTSESVGKPSAEANEVVFSKKYKTYAVGKSWVELTLEPYLAEQAEEYNLVTADYLYNTMENISKDQLRPIMAESRAQILEAFSATHKVQTPDGEMLISKLPDKSGVREFNKWLASAIEEFQEEY